MHGHPPQLQGDIELNDQQAKISPEINLIPADLAAASNLQNEVPIQATEVSAGFDLLIVNEEVIIDELLPPDLEDLTGGTTTASGHIPLALPDETPDNSQNLGLLTASGTLADLELPNPIGLQNHFGSEGPHDPSFLANISASIAGNDHAPGDLIFLDTFELGKGGVPGGNGGGKKDKEPDPEPTPEPGPEPVSSYTSGIEDTATYDYFNILIDFKGSDWTADLQLAFKDAADWISSVITEGTTDVFYRGKIIDDIKITAELKAIDGEGGILGQAGPTAIRTDGYLPATAIMQFDSADADVYFNVGLWDDIVIHEMLHTIGYGTVWGYLGLVSYGTTDSDGNTPAYFTGDQAIDAYDVLYDVTGDVPLEYQLGAGSDYSHWDEGEFDNEIMSPQINLSNDMTGLTVASLGDLGYDIIDLGYNTETTDDDFTAFTIQFG